MAETQKTILVVEDDVHILELITYHLQKAGFDVVQTFTGEEALERARVNRPDLILLDLMLPSMSGLEVCTQLKGDTATRMIPVIIVSARGADTDVVAGLEAGADDYIVKPFHPPFFVKHFQAMLQRVAVDRSDPDREIVVAELRIDPGNREVRRGEDPLPLTDLEFRILHYLALHAGRICTRGQIQGALGLAEDAAEVSVDDRVVSLSKKLGDTASALETIRRIGFRFKDSGS